MSRIDAYELLSCPYCQQVHRRTIWGSINLNITPKESFPNKDEPRLCANCGMEIMLDEMTSLGRVDSRTHFRYEDIFPSSRPLKKNYRFFSWPKISSRDTITTSRLGKVPSDSLNITLSG